MRTDLSLDRPLYAARVFEFAGHTFAVGERFSTTGLTEEQVSRLWESGAIDHDAHDPSTVSPPAAPDGFIAGGAIEPKFDGLTPGARVVFSKPPKPPRADDE